MGGATLLGRDTIYLVCLGCYYVEIVYDLFGLSFSFVSKNIFGYVCVDSWLFLVSMYIWVNLGFGLVC